MSSPDDNDILKLMAIRPEEQASAERLQKWLTELGRISDWKPVDPDPPDVCFTVGSERWAVEVTGLFQYADWAGNEKNIKNIQAPLQAMCERLEKAMPPEAKLDYGLFVAAPFLPKWKPLESRALDYINSGRTEQEYLDGDVALANFDDLLKFDNADPVIEAEVMRVKEQLAFRDGRVLISAWPGSGRVTWQSMLDGTAKSPGADMPGKEKPMIADIMASLEYSVQRILGAKLPRLQKVDGYDRKLILIWTDYIFADIDRVGELVSKRSLTSEDVDAVVLIESNARIGCVADPSGLFGIIAH